MRNLIFFSFLLAESANVLATEYYVATAGADNNPGTKKAPFKTIQKAADIMQPGDVCIVGGGTYREWVKPKRGGESESKRIVYKAAPGEKVMIKGSEQIRNWVKQNGNVWMVEIPDTYFGSYNPYKKHVSGGWIKYGHQYHLGDVYLNGKSYKEKMSLDTVSAKAETFTIDSTATTIKIYANFGSADPNAQLTEINVRECLFFPEIKGLRYITVDGFTMMHSAANWTCFRAFQHAMIGTYYGRNWIIENCRFSDARCTAIVCGNDPSREDTGFNADTAGFHIVRNNIIQRCGQAGITGFKGWTGSIIENNLIEDISSKKEFGGYETGGIKLHDAIDVIVRNNVIRKVYVGGPGQYAGIWLDWGSQGNQVYGNILYDMEAAALFLQNAHGPVFVYNNIINGAVRISTGNCVYAHNLFINSRWWISPEPKFSPVFWKPHTAEAVKLHPNTYQNDKIFNNIYVGKGIDSLKQFPGYQINSNVYYQGARKSQFDDSNSVVDENFKVNASIKSLPNGAEVSFEVNNAPFAVKCPLITYEFIGKFELLGQGFEDHEGKPLAITTDMLDKKRSKSPVVGPIENLKAGINTIKLTVNPR